jgi:hypothetical protein
MENEKKNNLAGSEAKNAVVETLAEDMAKVVGDNETGIVRKIIEEQEKADALDEKKSPERKKNKIFLFSGILLVLLAFVAVSVVFLFRKQIFTVPVAPQFTPIIFIDKTAVKEVAGLKKSEVIQTILNEGSSSEFKTGGIEGIYLSINSKILGFREFLNLMEANLDQTKIDFILDNFMIGAMDRGNEPNSPTGRDLFLLIKMRSVADVFDPMRTWESEMFSDLHGLFGININTDMAYLLTKDFEDGIIQNKNARILYDKDGNIVMMYVYIADDTLIITNSEPAVGEVISRLASNQIK